MLTSHTGTESLALHMTGTCSSAELVPGLSNSLKYLHTAFVLVCFAMTRCTYTHHVSTGKNLL